MKIIILCAGKGRRMFINYPKSLLKINTKNSILKNIYLNFIKQGIKKKDIIFATGYKPELIKKEIGSKVNFINNKKYASTNMVYTLINTIKKIDDDIIITYSDIVYDARNINKIINNKSQFITLVDKKWKALWKSKNKLESDSETLKIKDNFILELGKKTKDIRSAQARYVGLTKISKKNLRLIKAIYLDKIKKNPKRFLKIDMTNFFNFLIKSYFKLNYLQIVGKWDEFDDESDYKNYL
jgi:L-glutamine-phosphate cytidylyltransferase